MSKSRSAVGALNQELKRLGPSYFAREKNGQLQICQSFGAGTEVLAEGNSPDAALQALAQKRKLVPAR